MDTRRINAKKRNNSAKRPRKGSGEGDLAAFLSDTIRRNYQEERARAMMREKCTKKRAKKRASGGGAHRTTRGENRTNGKEEKYRKRDKNINKICVCQEFCVSLSSDFDKKKDESKMDRVGE